LHKDNNSTIIKLPQYKICGSLIYGDKNDERFTKRLKYTPAGSSSAAYRWTLVNPGRCRLWKDSRLNTRIENIKELISVALEFEAQNEDQSLEAFLSNVSLVSDIDNLEDSNYNIVLMTIHSCNPALEMAK
jgi:superfamily I DNA/RNA helicase